MESMVIFLYYVSTLSDSILSHPGSPGDPDNMQHRPPALGGVLYHLGGLMRFLYPYIDSRDDFCKSFLFNALTAYVIL
jgi:hypothetical protein